MSESNKRPNQTTLLMDKKAIVKTDELLNQLKLVSNRKNLYTLICNLISEGYYDDQITLNKTNVSRVYVGKEEAQAAREHVKKLGSNKLNEVIEQILEYELEQDDSLDKLLLGKKRSE